MKTLADFRWRFDEIDLAGGRLSATSCLIGSGNQDCVTMLFQVGARGEITAYRDPTRLVLDEMDGHMIRWMRNIDARFALYRCMSPDLSMIELKKYGAVQVTSEPSSASSTPEAPTAPPAEPMVEAPPQAAPASEEDTSTSDALVAN